MLHEPIAYCRSDMTNDKALFDEGLPSGYSIRRIPGQRFSGTLLDTFSGHLRSSGKLLVQLPQQAVLADPCTGEIQGQTCAEGWRFAKELHGGVIGYQLAEMTVLRAFTPVCKATVQPSHLTLLNELEKTVLRAQITVISNGDQRALWIALKPLRGYDDELALFVKCLKAAGFEPCDAKTDYHALIGLEDNRYDSKPDIDLAWSSSVYDSASAIARTFLEVARRNENGILSDTDTEFLHDFRVSLRRIRSMLSLFKQVYADRDCQRVKKELAAIMKQTNRLRDLDVYMMQRSSFFELVPESMYAGLETLFEIFKQERRESFDQLCAYLQSDDYRLRINDLQRAFSESGGMEPGYRAQESSGMYAGKTILQRYRKVARIARSIDAETPDEVVHRLRIQCKKLRYLMEFFTPLFPQRRMKRLVRSLKGLQDLLGIFNDCSVQRESLTQFVADHPLRGKKGMMLAESVGALAATLYQKQLRTRSEIDAALKDFANKQTNQNFRALFALEASE